MDGGVWGGAGLPKKHFLDATILLSRQFLSTARADQNGQNDADFSAASFHGCGRPGVDLRR
jgi:hypothetical protein